MTVHVTYISHPPEASNCFFLAFNLSHILYTLGKIINNNTIETTNVLSISVWGRPNTQYVLIELRARQGNINNAKLLI